MKTKFTKSHNIIAIESGVLRVDLVKMSPSFCRKDEDETILLDFTIVMTVKQ